MTSKQKASAIKSAFANGLEFLKDHYAINGHSYSPEEIGELATEVENMVNEWFEPHCRTCCIKGTDACPYSVTDDSDWCSEYVEGEGEDNER